MTEPGEWLLTRTERDNGDTRLDDRHGGDRAWSEGNLVTPLVHGATYFRELYDAVCATQAGDLVLFTDWQGDADERLIGEPGSEVLRVLGSAHERGVDVRGLVWRSHLDQTGFFATENRHLGERLQHRGAEVLLDMRVRAGGSHHQKFVVIRHHDDPSTDAAFVGGVDLAHNRRDDAEHRGDPQPQPLTREYGPHPPWHDVQVKIQGPAVYDVETVFRERWEDPTPLSRSPLRTLSDKVRGLDIHANPLPPQQPPPPEAGPQTVQLLRTYPNLRHGRDFPFARGGERSVARGYTKAIARATGLVYVEDQYFWGHDVADPFLTALRNHAELRLVVVIPLVPDVDGLERVPELLGRNRAFRALMAAAPERVAGYGIENHAGTPVYVHAKVCVIDDLWASVGSDNFNRRSWTHDSELSCVVLDRGFSRSLRLTLAAEHLDRLDEVDANGLEQAMADCVEPTGLFDAYAESADRLDAWHAGGRVGERPPGRLRRLPLPTLSRFASWWAKVPLEVMHDPDGRPGPIRGGRDY